MPRKSLDENTKKRGKDLCKKIRQAREAKGLSQEDLARSINISVETLRAVEQERTLVPGVFLAADIAKKLKKNLLDWIETESPSGTEKKGKRIRRAYDQ